MSEDWVQREPGLAQAAHELRRVLRRAKGRPILVLLIASLVTAAVVTKRMRKRPLYEGSVTLRIEETELGATRATMRGGALVDYIWSIALSNDTIIALCDEHNLYPEYTDQPDLRVAEFRSFFSVDESRNYFLLTRMRDDELRTARVNFHFVDNSPQRAVDVALSAVKAYMAFEVEQRRKAGEQAIEALGLVEDRARDAVEQRRARMAALPYKLAGDRKDLEMFRLLLDNVRARRRDLELLTLAGDKLGLGMQIAVVDRPLEVRRSPVFWVLVATTIFAIVLLLTAIAVGAFDSRLTSAEDVERLGLAAVGHVPAFAGQEFGSLDNRLDSPRRV